MRSPSSQAWSPVLQRRAAIKVLLAHSYWTMYIHRSAGAYLRVPYVCFGFGLARTIKELSDDLQMLRAAMLGRKS